ncbi:zinc finger BED domain-containing protein RICESLEEPER 2-like [Canna indica]|uniref:Zinc finger BED domain-containing protein RICESLEEPER 2-like n=1 Tax=Canna indica TaxID=4628 RepID=A0AAQ3Q7F1_9LILI|nr:zinc finger BED domain-containing protein RICESLEEPER 2-like [Canna indica]
MSYSTSLEEQTNSTPTSRPPDLELALRSVKSTNSIMANEEVNVENAIEANNDNQVVNLVEDNANEDNPFEKRKRKKTSGVWNEFTIIKLSNGTEKVQCNHCHVKLQKSATGTTTQYKRQLDNCSRRKYSAKGQLNLSVQPSKSGSASVQTWKYDQAKMREFISHMVLVHELPFAFVEYEIFNMVMKFSNPAYEKISRATVKGSEYPNANLFLPELWRIKNALNDKIDDDDECLRAMARKMKMQLVTFCFDAIYSKEEASKYIKVVRDSLYEIYQEYADAYAARVEKSNNTKSGQDENSDGLSRFSKGKLGSQKGR